MYFIANESQLFLEIIVQMTKKCFAVTILECRNKRKHHFLVICHWFLMGLFTIIEGARLPKNR